MTAPVRLLIHGASGRMGQALQRLVTQYPDLRIVATTSRSGGGQSTADAIWFDAANLDSAPDFDVAIDFSLPEGFDGVFNLCRQRGKAFVSGTTGLSSAQRDAMTQASAVIPILWAANFSLGIAVLEELVERAASALQHWDCDIVETHHTRKLDAPSGTALVLGAATERGGGKPRYTSLRAGDIVGEHLVQFASSGERIELIHRATDRDIFARGALHAAKWLVGKPAGQYRLRDALT